MKHLAVLGSTGSIGRQTLEVCDWFSEEFVVDALVGGSNWELLAQQIIKYGPKLAVIREECFYKELKDALPNYKGELMCGEEGVLAAATMAEADIVVAAISGLAGLVPVFRAIEAGKDIALANKEVLVAAGAIVTQLAKEKGVRILPVDSEHSAIWQCMQGHNGIKSLVLTASGGPFRDADMFALKAVTPEIALKHPTWNMGPKISIDSATLMNKGLEIIEARWLFDVPYENIDVVIHPQSIIHSMVRYNDSAVLAHMGLPDMRVPIQYALTYPERWANELPEVDFAKISQLTFSEPDENRFPCLKLAKQAGMIGESNPIVLNAVNEVLVWRFLKGEIGFWDIPRGVEELMSKHWTIYIKNLDTVLAVDEAARAQAKAYKGVYR